MNEDNNIIINSNYQKSKKKELQNNSNYELLEIKENKNNLKIYKYSNIKREIYHDLIFQYFFDKFEENDYKNAYIIVCIGKKGDGKHSSINSLFIIIKGINMEYNYRFILIEDKQQDNGLHLYYLKDINNKPIIIINCQGLGYILEKEYDENINKAFFYLFSYLLDHINLVCFITKELNEKLNIFIRYIFSCTIGLFTEEILQNFIILITHIDKNTIKEGSKFIGALSEDLNFADIKNKLSSKWYYLINNKNLFDDNYDELTINSFEQLNELYKEKILNSKQINTSNFSDIINIKIEIKPSVENIISNFKTLKIQNKKIYTLEKQINEYENKIENINNKIYSKDSQIDNINYYINLYNDELSELENQHNKIMYDLDNQYETITKRTLDSSSYKHTYCSDCKRNCHEYCDCFGSFLKRCKVFPVFGDDCERCGHRKYYHSINSYYRYVDKSEQRKISNYDKKNDEDNRYYKKKNEINDRIDNKRNEKDRVNIQRNYLYDEKNSLESNKKHYVNEKDKIDNYMKNINKNISSSIEKLINIDKKLKKDAMNKYYFDIKNEYIDELIDELEKKGNDENGQIKNLKDMKECIKIYNELTSNYLYLLGFKIGTG